MSANESLEDSLAKANTMGMTKKMQKKIKHLPPHIRAQLQKKMPDVDLDQLDTPGTMEAMMRSGQNIAQRAINNNVRDIGQIEQFLTQERTKQEIMETGHSVINTMQQKPTACNDCHKDLPNRKATCPRCNSVYYCNATCRKKDHKNHKKQCVLPQIVDNSTSE